MKRHSFSLVLCIANSPAASEELSHVVVIRD